MKWKEFQTRRPTRAELDGWQWDGLAIITGEVSKLVVIDCESLEAARWFWTNCGKSPSLVRTRRGLHLYFHHPGWHVHNHVRVRGKYDIRGDGGLAVAPPARTVIGSTAIRYGNRLTCRLFRAEWLPDNEGHPQQLAAGTKRSSARRPTSRTIHAVAGQGGHDQTYKAVCYLRDAGVSKSEAAMIMARWNLTNASPPWTDAELAHKLDDVFRS